MATQSGASAEALPLPKGGGSTRGLGDGFSPDLNRGTGSYAIRIQVPEGYRTQTPRLALTYNSAAGDGPFGYGWSLPLPKIQIDTDRGVADYLAPQFVLDGETLVAVGDGRFRPRVENAFHRIQRTGDSWEITDKSGTLTRLGAAPASRVSGLVLGEERTFAWLVDLSRDTSGNELSYGYFRDGGHLYVSRVAYAAFEVRFEYEARHDVTLNRRAGFALTHSLRCRLIEVHRPDQAHSLIRRYNLQYLDDEAGPSLLSRVTMEGFKHQADGSITRTEAPPVDFTYSRFSAETRRHFPVAENLSQAPHCPHCGGALKISAIADSTVIAKILTHLGLPARAPPRAAARAFDRFELASPTEPRSHPVQPLSRPSSLARARPRRQNTPKYRASDR